MAPPSLSVTVVTYRTPIHELDTALSSLAAAVARAREANLLGEVRLHVVDNSPMEEGGGTAKALADWPKNAGEVELFAGHGNVGYGRANNLVLPRLRSDFHLVMNPDVELAPDALAAALETMQEHPEVGLLAPAVVGDNGEPQYLCKRYPSVWVLFLRGFAPESMRRRHRAALDAYEMRDVLGDRFLPGVVLASGCFMLLRTPLFLKLGGFDARFFMYFEDYDLSMRVAREAVVAFTPRARIVHHGGEAARKGLRHVLWFVTSAFRFFSTHGWRL